MISQFDTAAGTKHAINASRQLPIVGRRRRRHEGRIAESRDMDDRQGSEKADADADILGESGVHS